MAASHYIGSPEDSGEIEPPRKRFPWRDVLVIALIAFACGLLVLAVAGCSIAPRERWEATLRITYANGQRITSADASGVDPAAYGRDSGAQGASEAPANGDAR